MWIEAGQGLRSEGISPSLLYGFEGMVEAIGTPSFGGEVIAFLNRAVGAVHFSAFKLNHGAPTRFLGFSLDGTNTSVRQSFLYVQGGYWKEDPVLTKARNLLDVGRPSVIRMNIDAIPSNDFRNVLYERVNVHDRLMICGGLPTAQIGISILSAKHDGFCGTSHLRRIRRVASTLISMIAKHESIIRRINSAARTLTSLPDIERTIRMVANDLPRREAEVCARIIYGVSGAGIASDLGISEQTAMTYRKRVYERLGIGSQRELLLWYLDLWQAVPLLNEPEARLLADQCGVSHLSEVEPADSACLQQPSPV